MNLRRTRCVGALLAAPSSERARFPNAPIFISNAFRFRPMQTSYQVEGNMLYDSFRPHRHTIRLQGYDYAQNGAYFVTLRTHQRACILSEVIDGQAILTPIGEIVRRESLALDVRYPRVSIDAFVVMPNHVHGILVFQSQGSQTNALPAPLSTLGRVLLTFKSLTTRIARPFLSDEGESLWQRNYYEKIIRNQRMLEATRLYIQHNPLNWDKDADHPDRFS